MLRTFPTSYGGAQALVEVLAESGVRHIFGLPGDTGVSFYDALYDARDRITHIMTRDERSASFMADVYARVTGRVGICEGPSGGGATYIVPGVAEAHGSAVPLICLTSDTPIGQQDKGVLTELDDDAAFVAGVMRLLDDDHRSAMSVRAREHVLAHFDSRRLVGDIERLYRTLLAKG